MKRDLETLRWLIYRELLQGKDLTTKKIQVVVLVDGDDLLSEEEAISADSVDEGIVRCLTRLTERMEQP